MLDGELFRPSLGAHPSFFKAKPHIQNDVAPLTLSEYIAAIGRQVLVPSEAPAFQERSGKEKLDAVRQDLHTTIISLGLDLHGLAWAMDRYSKAGGSKDILEYYGFRYGAVTCWLDGMGYLASHNLVHEVFRPKELREVLLPDGARFT